METVLIVIHLMVVAAMVVIVLLQKSEGGALGIGGGSGGFMTGRGQANALTRATAVLATIFFLTSLGLTLLANLQRKPTSVFEDAAKRPASTAPAKPGDKPASQPGKQPGGSLFDQLKRMDQSGNAPSSPAAPTAPAPTAPAPGSPPRPPAGGQ